MATNGNGGHDGQAIERLQAVAEAATAAAASASVEDFLSRAEAALRLLEAVGSELGSAGGADQLEVAAFAEGMRSELIAFVRKLMNRQRRRYHDLERVLGKIEG